MKNWQELEKEPIDLDAEPPKEEKTKLNYDKIQIGDRIKLQIEGVGAKGDVFGRYKQIVVFVKGVSKVTPGEFIEIKITFVRENCAFAVPV